MPAKGECYATKNVSLFLLSFFFSFAFADVKPLTVMLDWELNPDHAPLWVAQHQGFFAAQGLSVQLIPPSDASDPAKFAMAGKVDLALTYEPQWIVQQQQGLPLTWVATLVVQPLAVMMTSDKIKNLQQLRGQTIGYSSDAIDPIFLQTMFKSTHMTLKDVQLLNIHYDGNQALVAGRVAAVTGAMRNVEPIELGLKGFHVNTFQPEGYGVPSYAELIFVTGSQQKNDPRFKAFVIALQKGTAYLKQHPEETWQAFAKANPALNDDADHQIWLASVKYFADRPGQFNQQQYDKFKQFLKM